MLFFHNKFGRYVKFLFPRTCCSTCNPFFSWLEQTGKHPLEKGSNKLETPFGKKGRTKGKLRSFGKKVSGSFVKKDWNRDPLRKRLK